MASEPVTSHLRLGLNPRQTETVEKLLLAAEQELEETGPEGLTIRMVAQRAGVSPATAYTYLASKNHLFAELFWRRIVTEPGPEPDGDNAVDRIRVVTRHMAARGIMERRRMLALCVGAEVGCRRAHLAIHSHLALGVFANEPYQDDADLVENH